jgi:hypothetical protein
MNPSEERSGTDDDPLNMLEDLENIHEILNEQEIRLVNSIFVDMNDFYNITDRVEAALSEKKIDRRDLRVLYNSILKVVIHNHHVRSNAERKNRERNYVRSFFDLPKIINKWLFNARVYVQCFSW